MPTLGTVADDITGATTTGALLARSGARTALYIDETYAAAETDSSDYDAVIIQTGSRALPPEEAYQKVSCATRALLEMGVCHFQKRIDTTLRGSIGAEIDAMLDLLPDTIAVVIPAMPASRRILVGGYSVIDGVALVNTAASRDVRTPVRECYIPKLIAGQTERKTAFINLSDVLGGSGKILKSLENAASSRAEIIIIDAISTEDLDEIAKACIASGRKILSVDPGAFTARLAYQRGIIHEERDPAAQGADYTESAAQNSGPAESSAAQDSEPAESLAASSQSVLIIAGSATPVTKKQMQYLEDQGHCLRISIDPKLLMEGGEAAENEIGRAIKIAEEEIGGSKARKNRKSTDSSKSLAAVMNDGTPRLAEGDRTCAPRAILLETALHGEVLDLEAEEQKRGYTPGRGAELINEALGEIASLLMEHNPDRFAGLYATGGDTLLSVCRHLDSGKLSVYDYVIPQADVSRLTGKYAGFPVVGKGGLTGAEDTAVRIIDRLFMESSTGSKPV